MGVAVSGGGWTWFWWSFGSLVLLDLAVLSLILLLLFAATRYFSRKSESQNEGPGSPGFAAGRPNFMAAMVAEGVLAELFARGDITEDVYRERLAVLSPDTRQPSQEKQPSQEN
jgi:uncharacterized membrane protein